MEEETRRRAGLGRGLSALFGEVAEAEPESERGRSPRMVPVEHLQPGRYQPRREFDEEAAEQLVESVREKGILQPILVRRLTDDPTRFEIVAGERRWRAAQRAQLHEVPVLVRELSDRDAAEISLIENVQRQDLTPLEEAEGYRRLLDEFGHTQEELAKAVGKSRSHVANLLRLLALPDPVKRLVQDGTLSAGHARALLGVPNPRDVAEEVLRRGLNVRQTEELARTAVPERARKGGAQAAGAVGHGAPVKDADTVALERELTNRLGLAVSIDVYAQGGVVSIEYATLEQLDEVVRRLTQQGRSAA